MKEKTRDDPEWVKMSREDLIQELRDRVELITELRRHRDSLLEALGAIMKSNES